jgi:glycosyltransferase involved in cell wall biosynthesis
LPELNIHGQTGFMSNIGDIDDMVKNTLTLLDDKNLPTFKKNALARAHEFDVEIIGPKYIAYYNKVGNFEF